MNKSPAPKKFEMDYYATTHFSTSFSYKDSFLDGDAKCFITISFCSQTLPFANSAYPLHRHDNFELIFPYDTYHCRLNGVDLALKKGDALLIQPDDEHIDFFSPDEPFYSINFTCKSVSSADITRIFRNRITPQEQIVHIDKNENLQTLFDIIIEETQNFYGGRFSILNALSQVVFWKTIRNCNADLLNEDIFANNKREALLYRILAVFRKNLDKAPDIPLFCKQTNMSRSSLERVCHELFGMSAGRAFTSYRLDYAKRLLKASPELSIKAISQQLGFANQNHFSAVFRKNTGASPSEFQKARA